MSKYDLAFKLVIVKAYLASEDGYKFLANKFGIHEPFVVAKWMRVWQKEGIDELSKSKGSPTMSKKKNKLNKSTK